MTGPVKGLFRVSHWYTSLALLADFIFQCYRPQTWQFYLFFPALSISAIHKVLDIKFKSGYM